MTDGTYVAPGYGDLPWEKAWRRFQRLTNTEGPRHETIIAFDRRQARIKRARERYEQLLMAWRATVVRTGSLGRTK